MYQKVKNLLKNNTKKEILKKIFEKLLLLLQYPLSIMDFFTKKHNNYWIFPVYFIGKGHLSDNMLAVFEVVKNDENIKKIILIKDVYIEIDGKNIEVLPMKSLKAMYYIMKSNVIFVQHSIWLDLSNTFFQIVNPLDRKIINLWHGIPLKDISHQNTGIYNKRAMIEMKNYYIITSSTDDISNMQKAFHITKKENFWITGLPRNDFLVMPENQLPNIYKKELIYLRDIIKNKKLVIYAPTYREKNVGGRDYHFTSSELEKLNNFLESQNMILGVRYHSYLAPSDYSYLLDMSNIIDLSSAVISDVRMLIRESVVVITDYSSLFVDACYIDKKCISFAYDYEHYKETQRGFFYEFEEIFPSAICRSFDELLKSLQITELTQYEIEKIEHSKKIFFEYLDGNNSKRVVEKVMEIIN